MRLVRRTSCVLSGVLAAKSNVRVRLTALSLSCERLHARSGSAAWQLPRLTTDVGRNELQLP
jgi:hypothetical protein